MVTISTIAAVVLAVFLITSSLAKVAHPFTARQSVDGLLQGVLSPSRATKLSGILVNAVVGIEWLVAVALVIAPASHVVVVLAWALFAVFAALGLLARVAGRDLDCGCMGALHSARLGWTQVSQLAAVSVLVLLIASHPPTWTFETKLEILALCNVAPALLFIAVSVPLWRGIKRDRLSLAEASAYFTPTAVPPSTLGGADSWNS